MARASTAAIQTAGGVADRPRLRVVRGGEESAIKRVVVDLEKLRHPNCGLGRFSRHLAESLERAAGDTGIELVPFLHAAAPWSPPASRSLPAAFWRKESCLRWLRPLVRPLLGHRTTDLWHVTHQQAKYLPLDCRVPVLLTIHDLNFLHDPDASPRRIDRKLAAIQQLVTRSEAIVTDSRYVAEEVRLHLDLGDRPLHVVPLGLEAPAVPAASRPDFLPPGRFLFSVGNCLPHKNFHVLLELLAHLDDFRLVIAGKKTTPYGRFLASEIVRLGIGERVVMPGEVDDATRQWLYEHCEGFLFPSFAEGFGFPVLEAMQAGRPVFSSRCTSLPEVIGNHGFYFESFSAESMAEVVRAGLRQISDDPGLVDSARRHAASFSWQRTAADYLRIYRELLDATGPAVVEHCRREAFPSGSDRSRAA
jgi:glycosyltransferase involved in cell wall biosynthesis